MANTLASTVAPSSDDILAETVDLLSRMASVNVNEEIRVQGQNLLVHDWHRRHAAEGKHPVTGETPEQYKATLDDPAKGGRGVHPITGEQEEEYNERSRGGKQESPKVVGKG